MVHLIRCKRFVDSAATDCDWICCCCCCRTIERHLLAYLFPIVMRTELLDERPASENCGLPNEWIPLHINDLPSPLPPPSSPFRPPSFLVRRFIYSIMLLVCNIHIINSSFFHSRLPLTLTFNCCKSYGMWSVCVCV